MGFFPVIDLGVLDPDHRTFLVIVAVVGTVAVVAVAIATSVCPTATALGTTTIYSSATLGTTTTFSSSSVLSSCLFNRVSSNIFLVLSISSSS